MIFYSYQSDIAYKFCQVAGAGPLRSLVGYACGVGVGYGAWTTHV